MQNFFSFIIKNWLHIVVVFSLIVVNVDLHYIRLKVNKFDKECRHTRERIDKIEANVAKNIKKD